MGDADQMVTERARPGGSPFCFFGVFFLGGVGDGLGVAEVGRWPNGEAAGGNGCGRGGNGR